MRLPLVGLCCLLLLPACAGGHRADSAAGTPRRDPNLITAEELAASNANNAFEAVSRLRPHFIRPVSDTRYAGRMIYPNVYVDEVASREGVAGLRQISLERVRAIRYYSVYDARTRFGIDNRAGVIHVITLASPEDAEP